MSTTSRVVDVALTGGPGAGKSTVMARAVEVLQERGWRVFCVPEAPTLLAANGAPLVADAYPDRDSYLRLQAAIVRTQLNLRAAMLEVARASGAERVVLLEDGDVRRNGAYFEAAEWPLVAELAHTDLDELWSLYDAGVYLETWAALGSWDRSANNSERVERDAEAALLRDAATIAQWLNHPHLEIVSAASSFEAKVDAAIAAVLRAVGDPEPLEAERKFLLAGPPSAELLAELGARPISLRQSYLTPGGDGIEERVRRREADGWVTYFRTRKIDRPDGSRREEERLITEGEYLALLERRAEGMTEIVKTRHVFVHGGRLWELDEVHAPVQCWLLEVEVASMDEVVTPPVELGAVLDVSEDRAWRNSSLARSAS